MRGRVRASDFIPTTSSTLFAAPSYPLLTFLSALQDSPLGRFDISSAHRRASEHLFAFAWPGLLSLRGYQPSLGKKHSQTVDNPLFREESEARRIIEYWTLSTLLFTPFYLFLSSRFLPPWLSPIVVDYSQCWAISLRTLRRRFGK